MVRVLPEAQRLEDGIARVDYAIAVTTVRHFVELRERDVAVRRGRLRLLGEVPEQLLPVVDPSVAVAVEREESVVGAGCNPGDLLGDSVAVEIEAHAARDIRER